MTRVVSTINLKGGTGKTSITVALAEFLAKEAKKRVLVIDVDPQTNATVSLISQQEWKKRNDSGRTLAQLFLDRMNGTDKFTLKDSIIRGVSNVGSGIKGLDLLPSSLDLVDVQDKLPLMSITGAYHPVKVLEEVMMPLLSDRGSSGYDYVLADCPPNLGLITQNALKVSDAYLIPVIPDILSTLGIPQILQRVQRFERTWQTNIEALGIILSKVRSIALHKSMTADLKNRSSTGVYPEVWDTEVRESAKAALAMDFEAKITTLKQKYGYDRYYDVYYQLMNEFLKRCPT